MMRKGVSDRPASSSAAPHGLIHELTRTIYHLMLRIGALLGHRRIDRASLGDAKGDYDIWEKIGDHLGEVADAAEPDAEPAVRGRETSEPVARGADAKTDTETRANIKTDTALPPAESTQLTARSKQSAIGRLLPRMHDQLQRKTMEHINIALIMAHEGNADGARLHAEFAQNAMHTASRFMSRENYQIFEEKVERRLESIVRKRKS